MLNIVFLPAKDREDIGQAARVYGAIWSSEGKKIIGAIEKVTRLKFQEREVQALVRDGKSRSDPLILDSRYKSMGKRAILIHELLHRLLYISGIDKREVNTDKMEIHKILDLVLYDVWAEVYGKDFADMAVSLEKTYSNEVYKKAWEWALAMNSDERKMLFRKFASGDLTSRVI